MSDTIDVPKVGPVKKQYVYGGAAALAAYVLYRYWAAGSGGDDELVPEDPAFGDGEVLPTVPGAYTAGGGGIPDTTDTGETGEGPPTTNDEWSRRAAAELAGQGGMDYASVVDALGAYLARRPVSTEQQRLIQAAIAVMGYPPTGSYTVISGGDATITVAPSGVKATPVSATAVDLTWQEVAGATSYRIYRSGARDNVGTSLDGKAQVGGLQPNTSYSFTVAAVSMGGKVGPSSSSVTAKTKSVSLAKPTGVRISAITKSGATVTWNTVKGASGYRLYVDNNARGAADKPPYKLGGLSSNHTHRVEVAADAVGQEPGPRSTAVSFKTKK